MAGDTSAELGHYFSKKSFHKPTYCHHCTDLLWGLIGQGLICKGNVKEFIINSNSCLFCQIALAEMVRITLLIQARSTPAHVVIYILVFPHSSRID